VNREQHLHGFQFHYYEVFHYQVQPQTGVQGEVIVYHRKRHLPFHYQPSLLEFVQQAKLINAFETSRPQRDMPL
jgi:hypothetical protein